MSVQPADTSHAALLASLHAACFAKPWNSRTFEDLLRDGTTAVLLAREPREDRPCGVLAYRVAADECEILTLAVLPEQRRHGHGEALMHSAIQEAQMRGATAIFLEVNVGNLAALGLYRKMGFETVGARRNYYRSCDSLADAHVLRLQLSAWESRRICPNVNAP